MKTAICLVLFVSGLAHAPAVHAQDEATLGLNADVGLASAYFFRGANVFKDKDQSDQNFLLAPSLTWSIPGIPLQVGYWGAFQLNGDNKSVLVDAGLGAEQDLWVGYTYSLPGGVTANATLTAYYYPLAKKEVAGTNNALWLEPAVSFSYSTIVDVAIKVAYMHGVQDALEVGRYTYISPSVAKSFGLTDTISLVTSLSAGYKLFNKDGIEDNVWDAQLTASLPITLPYGTYVKPSLGLVWTNMTAKDMGDEIGYYGAVNVGINL